MRWTILLVLQLSLLTVAQPEANSTAALADDSQLASLVDVPLAAVAANATETTETQLEPTAEAASNVTDTTAETSTSQEATSAPSSSSIAAATTTDEQESNAPIPTLTPSPAPSPAAEPAATESFPPLVEIPSSPPADLPSPPEFLSFNEWREKYVVLPDPSARRKKGGQRARQDGQGGAGAGGGGAAFDGDGADLGSLFSGEEGAEAGGSDQGGTGAGAEAHPSAGEGGKQTEGTTTDLGRVGRSAPSSSSSSPIQPLPNVGTGDLTDPLLHLKDRSNYAAYECNAMVHRSSRQMKGSTSILVEKKDRYMLTPCSAEPKFVEVELCDEIRIDTVVLASFELFSSMFKHFRMSCSGEYPGKPESWHDLGYFRARNARGIQVFRTRPVSAFCRYVRINFLSHYGSEFYCPVSLFRVYGYTQIDAYREDERKKEEEEARALEAAMALEDEDEDELELTLDAAPETVKKDKWEADGKAEDRNTTAPALLEPESTIAESSTITSLPSSAPQPSSTLDTPTTSSSVEISASPSVDYELSSTFTARSSPSATASSEVSAMPSTTTEAASSTVIVEESTQISVSTPVATASPADFPVSSASESSSESSTSSPVSPTTTHNATTSSATTSTSSPSSEASTETAAPSSSASASSQPPSSPSQAVSATPTPSSSTTSSSTTTSTRTIASETPSSPPVVSTRPLPRNDTYSPPPPPRPPPIPPPSREPQPGESIYGTIMKRLASLEHNQTLAMHYIEAQSGMLREAFLRVELRLGEVEGARHKQEQAFRQSLLELEKLRLELEQERLVFASQVNQLAQDVRLEKRLSIAQLVGLLVIVLFVGFTRGSPTSPFLHLTSAQAIRAAAKEEAKRKAARMEEDHTESPSEGPRRHTGYRANSLTIARVPSKRHSSLAPKPAPRRHYGNGSSGPSSSKNILRSPRTWTPPPRHASAPPEDPFATSLATALEGGGAARGETTRRRGSKHAKFSHSVSYASSDHALGLAIDTGIPRMGSPLPPRASSSASNHLNRPFFPTRPSIADDADTEPSEMGGDPEEYSASDAPSHYRRGGLNSGGLPSGDTDGGYRTYSASEEEDDESRPPSPLIRDGSSPFLKPPRPVLGKRGVSSPGAHGLSESIVPFPTDEDTPRRVLLPELNLPSPPPEPPEVENKQKDVVIK